MTDYITDTKLINKLNSLRSNKMKTISDPELIDKLNKKLAEKKGLQQQEQYSNPTQFPGFNDLPKNEQLQRIAFSQFDPANQSPTGGYVNPGQYESKSQRLASSILPTLFSGGLGEVAEGVGVVPSIINSITKPIANISTGTLSNLAYESPEIKSKKDLSNAIEKNAMFNTALEGIPIVGRSLGDVAELFNPLKYMANKADIIQNEAKLAKSTMNDMYSPVRKEYDDLNLTVNPKKYLESLGINREELSPGAKIIHDDFLNEAKFKNLHKLQSKLGNDWAKTASDPSTYEKSEAYKIMRDNINDKIQLILSRDKNSLNQYNKATDFAKNTYYPYVSSDALTTVSRKGSEANIDNEVLKSAIQKGMNKPIGKSSISEETREVIPKNHPLTKHLQDMNKKENLAMLSKAILPTALGALGGGLGATAGLSAGGALLSPLGNKALSGTIQNPIVEELVKILTPIYYGSGRAGINSINQNK